MTPLDHAFGEINEENEAARLRFFDLFLGAELFLALTSEPSETGAEPISFDLEMGSFVAVFDTESRLADFAEREIPYLGLSGRTLVDMLLGSRMGIALNPSVAPSELLITEQEVTWLAEQMGAKPDVASDTPQQILPPTDASQELILAIDAKLSSMVGMGRFAYLANAEYESEQTGLLLAIVDPVDGAGEAIATALNETMRLNGAENQRMDITFIDRSDPIAANFAKVALRFDIPAPPKPIEIEAPGSNPDKPPILH